MNIDDPKVGVRGIRGILVFDWISERAQICRDRTGVCLNPAGTARRLVGAVIVGNMGESQDESQRVSVRTPTEILERAQATTKEKAARRGQRHETAAMGVIFEFVVAFAHRSERYHTFINASSYEPSMRQRAPSTLS